LVLVGCAARPVTPVAISQPGDATLTCAGIDTARRDNALRAAELLKRDREVESANTGKMIAAVVFSGWIAMSIDLSREEQITMRSLLDRNTRLDDLARENGCPAT
jgi:hypothetical protein